MTGRRGLFLHQVLSFAAGEAEAALDFGAEVDRWLVGAYVVDLEFGT